MGEVCTLVLFITVGVHPDLLYIECLQPTFFAPCIYVHVDIKKIINKNKNIFEKMSEYVRFSLPPTYFLHIRYDH